MGRPGWTKHQRGRLPLRRPAPLITQPKTPHAGPKVTPVMSRSSAVSSKVQAEGLTVPTLDANTDGAGVDALGTVVTGIVAFGVRSGAGLEVDLFRPIVIELMASELIAVGGTRVVGRPSGTDGERDTSVTSVAVTAGAVMGTDPEEL